MTLKGPEQAPETAELAKAGNEDEVNYNTPNSIAFNCDIIDDGALTCP